MIETIHTVILVYNSPYCAGGDEDNSETVATFSTKEAALEFVEWAEGHRKRIKEEILKLPPQSWSNLDISDKLNVPEIIRMTLPTSDYHTDNYYYQYDSEFEIDPIYKEIDE